MRNRRFLSSSRRMFIVVAVFTALGGGLLVSASGCSVGYVLTQGYYQGKLLAGREPIDEVIRRDTLDSRVRARLELILRIKAFGEERLGLKPTQNYSTVNLKWKNKIWNLSACRELKFEPYTWWFPIVGTVPYKGFFRRKDAERESDGLRTKGYDVMIREVAGYSTLGWFKDPVLPSMLQYDEGQLADLVLHELAHATLFIPGQVAFNESFASFVGTKASLAFLRDTYGGDSPELKRRLDQLADARLYETFMHDLYQRLDEVYRSGAGPTEKRARKEALLRKAQERFGALPFRNPKWRGRSLNSLNNARLMQFKQYNSSEERFQALYDGLDGDMKRFLERVAELATQGTDPFEALEAAVGPLDDGHQDQETP